MAKFNKGRFDFVEIRDHWGNRRISCNTVGELRAWFRSHKRESHRFIVKKNAVGGYTFTVVAFHSADEEWVDELFNVFYKKVEVA